LPQTASRRPLILGAALLCCAVAAPSAVAANGGAGAVFTTDAQGLAVNENLFGAAEDVHLNGGPPCNSSGKAGLADGWYVFRVTDPSGKLDMTAGESLTERRFRVRGRAVVESGDPQDHPIRTTACGAVLQVGPFTAGSANGVYKLWVAPDGAAARKARTRDRRGVFHPCRSKTDNFRLDTGGDGGDGGDGGGEYLAPPPDPTPPPPGTLSKGKRPTKGGGGGTADPVPTL
jgi:hypothetical protein